MNILAKEHIEKAYKNINSNVAKSNLIYADKISLISQAKVHLKLENQQITGSFKIRGASNKIINLLSQNPKVTKVVAASTGNHAAAVAYAAQKYNVQTIIFAPESLSDSKLQNLKNHKIELKLIGKQSSETERLAFEYAAEKGLPFIHPYNDPDVISGQGTIAIELLDQLKNFDAVFVPIGGGGLISGIATYLKEVAPEIKVIGVQPQNAPEMHDSLICNRIVEPSDLITVADGTAGGLDPDTITFDICKKLVDYILLVSEDEIARSVYLIYKYHGFKVEPAAALSVSAILKYADQFISQKLVAILSGNKLNDKLFEAILKRYSEM